ncbi:hypothetical protein Gohar_005782, partial [Gossypium harknessii]|nr:hypothetical protein [Gossypium harknessii]MBA0806326.1 hypothetical protein [Gossypium harknessii]
MKKLLCWVPSSLCLKVQCT